MLDLTFGEQVKIILSRRGMTIKELAETIEARTGKKMSRQNLTQRLGRDNFQEQDMRMIAEILGCPFQLSILGESVPTEKNYNIYDIEDQPEKESVAGESMPVQREEPLQEEPQQEELQQEELPQTKPIEKDSLQAEQNLSGEAEVIDQMEAGPESHEREMTIGELVDMNEELDGLLEEKKKAEPEKKPRGWMSYLMRRRQKNEEPKETSEGEAGAQNLPESHLREEEPQTSAAEEYTEEPGVQERPDNVYEHEYAESVEESYGQGYAEGLYGQEPAENVYGQEYAEEPYGQEPAENVYGQEYAEEPYGQESAENIYGQEAGGTTYEQESAESRYQREYTEEFVEYAEEEEDLERGDVNPYTGREYQSNSVRMHPSRIGYVQVYDRSNHAWTDMTEWAFLGYQERKKMLLGKDYDPPIYLD